MNKLKAFSFVILLASMGASFADSGPQTTSADYQSIMNPPTMQYTWLGGDAAASVELTPKKYLWLFGDTLVGQNVNDGVNQLKRYSLINSGGSKYFFHSSAGITENQNNSWGPIVKYFNKDSAGYPAGIINSDTKSTLLWTVNGIMLKHKLLIMTQELPVKGLTVGSTFALVDNPLDNPKNWKYHLYRVLPMGSPEQLFSGVVRQGDWIYFYGLRGIDLSSPKTKQILARINIDDAENANWSKLFYWQGGNKWGSDSHKAQVLQGLVPQTEESIEHSSDLGWYTLQIHSGEFKVHLYTAKALTGPWQDDGVVFNLPKKWLEKIPGTNKPLFDSYAVKIHPEFSKGKEIVFTYNTNMSYSFTGDDLTKIQQLIPNENYSGLYIPQFVVCHTNSSISPYSLQCSQQSSANGVTHTP